MRRWLLGAIVIALVAGGASWLQQRSHAKTAPQMTPPPAAAHVAPGPQRPAVAADATRAVISGKVIDVIDGDTIEVKLDSGPIRVRLESIDAPEHDQPLGNEARANLKRLVLGKVVDLEPFEQDRYERLAAYVFVGEQNVGLTMVENGYAWAYFRYLHERSYCDAEFRARAAQRGLWALPEKDRRLPQEWRLKQKGIAIRWSKHDDDTLEQCLKAVGKHDGGKASGAAKAPVPLMGGTTATAPGSCRIKGNINGHGEKIYHVPGSTNYERTRITTSAGERWFCTENEARAAGWRAPRG